MPTKEPQNPKPETENSQGEYDFPEGHDPLHKDEAQAEASEYGIYGYATEAGEVVEQEAELHEEGRVLKEPTSPGERAAKSKHATGGKDWNETDHGAGFDQPMESPQREAARSDVPPENEE